MIDRKICFPAWSPILELFSAFDFLLLAGPLWPRNPPLATDKKSAYAFAG
jgi:hypothetical protein